MKLVKKFKNSKNVLSYLILAIIGLIIGYTIWIPGKSFDKSEIAVYLEQDDGTYQFSTTGGLGRPVGYIYNETKSSCVNGSTITHNGSNISLSIIGSDTCTLYYDQRAADITISSVTVDGSSSTSFPTDRSYTVSPSCTGATASWNYATWSLDISAVTSASATCSIAFTSRADDNLASIITSLSGTSGYCTSTSYTTESTCESAGETWYNVVNENGYRYEGKNPNNYVWFNDELWRIIGVFDTTLADGTTTESLVKIIRNDTLGTLLYDVNSDFPWDDGTTKATLNTLLNDYYYNSTDFSNSIYTTAHKNNENFTKTGIKSQYRSMIENVMWNLGDTDLYNDINTAYTAENSSSAHGNIDSSAGYIGLMQPSDYGYSVLASSCARTTTLSSYASAACSGNSWLNKGYSQHTMAIESTGALKVYLANSMNWGPMDIRMETHPVLYLKSDTSLAGGTGAMDDPYIIY